MSIFIIISLIGSPLRGSEAKNQPINLAPIINQFGFELCRELFTTQKDKNLLVSPFSIAIALTMTTNGANGATRKAMADCLGFEEANLTSINHQAQALTQELIQRDPQLEMKIANSLWARKGVEIRRDFIQRLHQFYDADVTVLDFNAPDAVTKINNWVSKKTGNLIKAIVNRINPEHALFVINAIYFKGKWQHQFDPKLTADGKFHLPDGTTQKVKMMANSGKFNYLAGDGFEAVELPYGKGKMSMFLFLPAEGIKLEGFLQKFTMDNWQASYLPLFESRQGSIKLPRFQIEYEQSLKEVLIRMGMGIAFDLERADFSGMSKKAQLAIGDVKHKSFIEVQEEGTEAAAVTSVEMVMTSIPVQQPPFNLVFDRPFLFLIRDNSTGTILFLGVVNQPAG